MEKDYKKLAKTAFILSIIPYITIVAVVILALVVNPVFLWFLVGCAWLAPITIPLLAVFSISSAISSLKIKKNSLATISIILICIPIVLVLIFISAM